MLMVLVGLNCTVFTQAGKQGSELKDHKAGP